MVAIISGNLFGWKKDRFDSRDYLLPRIVRVPEELPKTVIHSGFLSSVRDQGNEGSCVGFGISGLIYSQAGMSGWTDSELFSPRWVYNGARFLEGRLDEEGAYPRDALKWLARKGNLLEKFWPYEPWKESSVPPPGRLDSEAVKYPLVSYRRVDGGLFGLCEALAQGHFVAIGAPWFDSWMITDSEGRLARVDEKSGIAGGHEFLMWGYSDFPQGYLCCRNSWGEKWGKGGDFFIPMSAVEVWKKTYGYDAYTVEIKWEKEPPKPSRKLKLFLDDKALWEGEI